MQYAIQVRNMIVEVAQTMKHETSWIRAADVNHHAACSLQPWLSTTLLVGLVLAGILSTFLVGQRPKTGIRGPFGAKNRYILKTSKKRTPRALLLVQR